MPTAINRTQRYIAPEVTKVYWATSLADMASPLRAEMEAGLDFTGEIAAMTGWEIGAELVPAPDLGTKITGRTTGRVNPGDAQISFYASQDTDDIRGVLERGDLGYVLILDGGDVPGQIGRVFAVQVSSISPTVQVEGTENSRIMVAFAISQVTEKFTIPALT